MEEERKPFWRRHRVLLWSLVSAGVALAGIGVTLTVLARHLEPFLRAQIVSELEARFHTRVELDSFHVSVREGQEAMWGIWADGRGLRIWPPNLRNASPAVKAAAKSIPLIQLDEFSFHVPLKYRETQRLRIPEVRLTGLRIVVPPKPGREKNTGIEGAMRRPTESAGGGGMLQNVVVDRVLCRQAQVEIETDKPGKLPLIFEIQELRLKHLRTRAPMAFEAVLTNAKPKGLIRTDGSFGPWDVDDPGESALRGKYRFEKADLGEFNGIAGILSSTGTYDGTLRDLGVTGTANVPDFSLTKFGTKMELDTSFKARVDGTDGDTYLDEVDAQLGQSQFRLKGKIVRVRIDDRGREIPTSEETGPEPTEVGHLIEMNVDVPAAKIEDFLKLVSKSGTPVMTGTVSTEATLEIPPGKRPVPDRIKLDGTFKLDDARFTNGKIQGKIQDLSLRGQGKPGAIKNSDPDSVVAGMEGSFQMANGVIALPNLKYSMPGVQISLKGTYGLDGALHFDGMARMQATISQMVGGWKGWLLKPVDPFFKKKGAGTQVPVKVRGTRQNPDFSVDLGKMGTHPATPK